MKTYQDIKSATYIDAIINYAETLLGIEFRSVGRLRYSTFCPFHADTKDSFRVYVNGNGEVRFHCFGACNSDWDIYDVIMIRKKCRFRQAQEMWAEHLGIKDFKAYDGNSPCIPEPDEEQEPDDTVDFIEPVALDKEIVDALDAAASFYNGLLMSNEDRFKKIWDYLARRGIDKDAISKFKIGYAPPYADEQYKGRALIDHFIERFEEDYRAFNAFSKGGLVRLLNDSSVKGYGFYLQQIAPERGCQFSSNYGDYFAGRIVFPIYGIDAWPVGFVGRRPDNRGVRWLKQRTGDTSLSPRTWLFGIDKAARYIRQYRTIILVEGIFDYFAFYNLLQDQGKPVVVSTLGSRLTAEAAHILNKLDIENFIVAYDWDPAGRKGISQIASDLGAKVFYLGGMKEDQDPYDKLNPVINAISGFSLNRLMTAAKKAQEKTDKPVNVSHITSGPRGQRNVIFKPDKIADMDRAEMEALEAVERASTATEYHYDTDEFLPLLTYGHGNKAMLGQTIEQIIMLLEACPAKSKSEKKFRIPSFFLDENRHVDLGPGIILWLRLVIEQQSRKKKVQETDSTLAEWLHTSRATVSTYKRRLKEQGFLKMDSSKRPAPMSVVFHPKA
jgi:DNA primase